MASRLQSLNMLSILLPTPHPSDIFHSHSPYIEPPQPLPDAPNNMQPETSVVRFIKSARRPAIRENTAPVLKNTMATMPWRYKVKMQPPERDRKGRLCRKYDADICSMLLSWCLESCHYESWKVFGLPMWCHIRSNAAWLNTWKIITITVRPLQLSPVLSVQQPIDRHLRAFHLAGDHWSWTPWPLATCWPWNDGGDRNFMSFSEFTPLNETWKSMNRAVCVYREIQ